VLELEVIRQLMQADQIIIFIIIISSPVGSMVEVQAQQYNLQSCITKTGRKRKEGRGRNGST
jgi:hypothetical protein